MHNGGRRAWRYATREVRVARDALRRETRHGINQVCATAARPVPDGLKRARTGAGLPADALFRRVVEMLASECEPGAVRQFIRANGSQLEALVDAWEQSHGGSRPPGAPALRLVA